MRRGVFCVAFRTPSAVVLNVAGLPASSGSSAGSPTPFFFAPVGVADQRARVRLRSVAENMPGMALPPRRTRCASHGPSGSTSWSQSSAASASNFLALRVGDPQHHLSKTARWAAPMALLVKHAAHQVPRPAISALATIIPLRELVRGTGTRSSTPRGVAAIQRFSCEPSAAATERLGRMTVMGSSLLFPPLTGFQAHAAAGSSRSPRPRIPWSGSPVATVPGSPGQA